MTYLYSVAGYAYLHDEFLRSGNFPKGVEVPLQMATIAQGVLGQTAGWLMLLVVMVTLYDAQFPFYDTYDRSHDDRRDRGHHGLGEEAPLPVLLLRRGDRWPSLPGLYLVLLKEPLIVWMMVATAAVAYRSIGSRADHADQQDGGFRPSFG